MGVKKSTQTSLDDVRVNPRNCQQCRLVMGTQRANKRLNAVGSQAQRHHSLGNVLRDALHLVGKDGVVNGNANCGAERADADDEAACNGDELRRRRELSDCDKGGERHAEGESQEHRVPPGLHVGGAVGRGHAGEEGDEDDEGQDGDPADFASNGAVDAREHGSHHGGDEHDGVSSTYEKSVCFIQDGHL